MNINSTVELSFDLTKRKNPPTVSAKQRDDKTRSITVKLTQGGKPFKKPDNAEIKLCGTKPDSTVFEYYPTESSDDIFTFVLTDYVLSAEGKIRCEVKYVETDGDEVRVCSTETFYIKNEASAMIADHSGVTAELQSVERATAAAYNAAEVAARTAEELYEARNNGEFNGKSPVKGVDYWTDADKNAVVSETVEVLSDDGIPDYWESYLEDKINTVNKLQEEGGKDCFSFVVMADMHYPTNLGKLSPLLAKRILDKCDIRFALCLGDVQNRGCHDNKELVLAENKEIDKMLSPILDRLLRTEGNHEGAYGFLDRDGDGISNSGKENYEKETYVNNLTPAELHSAIYRKVGLVGDVHFDESGSGYYVDDTANKVRYIILNSQRNEYELQADGTPRYPKMWCFNFTQSQFDLVIEALYSIPSDSYGVVVASHCPIYQEIADAELMRELLKAYKNKGRYKGEYAGIASGGADYVNLAEPLPDNTADKSKWINDHRISSSGISEQAGKTVTNPIPCKNGDVVRVKGVSFTANTDRVMLTGESLSYKSGQMNYVSALPDAHFGYALNEDVHEFTILSTNAAYTHIRFSFDTPTKPEDIIITVNEELVESSRGYDYVSVNADFSEAKGELVGYFAGHVHTDRLHTSFGLNIITTRCDAKEENTEDLKAERVKGTVTEQSFDVFTVNKATRTVYATKIGAGSDRVISY